MVELALVVSANGSGNWVAGAGDGARFRYLAEPVLSALALRTGAGRGARRRGRGR